MLRAFLLVGLGGFLGSISRYGINQIVTKYISNGLPYATFLVNIIGCFLIGLLFGLMQRNQIDNSTWLIVATGFCGAFTTFSTFALENNILLNDRLNIQAMSYTLLSLFIGILLCRLGIFLVK